MVWYISHIFYKWFLFEIAHIPLDEAIINVISLNFSKDIYCKDDILFFLLSLSFCFYKFLYVHSIHLGEITFSKYCNFLLDFYINFYLHLSGNYYCGELDDSGAEIYYRLCIVFLLLFYVIYLSFCVIR
jgi:hypothetical protein